MSNIFFTSDTHAYHRNIAGPKVSQWKSGYRDFNDEYEMTAEIIKQINNTVDKDDTLYHLGDWSFGGIDEIWEFRKQINCKNIHLILGNHDHHIENNKELPNLIYNSWSKYVRHVDDKKTWVT
jgi:calcineurin-like phosphoesterase family protein